MSNLLNEKCALAKLRAELKERKGKLCRCCKKFRHLAQNCRNKNEKEKGATMSQNKFEILSSRVMQYGVEEKTIRSMRMVEVKYFKCGEEGHKCRWCLSWKKEKRMACPTEGKVYQGDKGKPACLERGKAQKKERKLRRVEESEVVHSMRGKAQQEEWRRSSWEELRKRAE